MKRQNRILLLVALCLAPILFSLSMPQREGYASNFTGIVYYLNVSDPKDKGRIEEIKKGVALGASVEIRDCANEAQDIKAKCPFNKVIINGQESNKKFTSALTGLALKQFTDQLKAKAAK